MKNHEGIKVQSYKDINKMDNEEKKKYLSKPYITKNGIIVSKKFNNEGKDINECLKNYLLTILKG